MKITISRCDTIWSYIGTVFAMGSGLIIIPFVLWFLDADTVGVYYVFISLSAIASLFDLGFSPSIARNMAFAWSGAEELLKQGGTESKSNEPNFKLIKQIIFTCKVLYFVLALVALLIALTIGTYYIYSISEGILSGSQYTAWIIYSVAIFLNILYSYYSVFLRGVGAVSEVNKATIFAKLFQIVASIVMLARGLGLVGVSIAYLLYGLTFRLISKRYFFKYKRLGEKLKVIKAGKGINSVIELLKRMWPNTWREGLVTISNYILNQATTVIAPLYLTLAETGVYSLAVQLTSAIATIAATLYTAYQPSLQSAYTNRDTETQKKNMSVIVFSYCGIFLFGMLGLIIVGKPLLSILKQEYNLSVALLLGTGVYQFILKYRNCFCSYISTTNRLIYAKSFVISAVLCITFSVLLAGVLKWGVTGLIIAQIMSQAVFNAWYWPAFVYRELKMIPRDTLLIGYGEIRELFGIVNKQNN